MSLDKAIEHGKERREPYRGSKAVDGSCRNHGGCPRCEHSRTRKAREAREREEAERALLAQSDDAEETQP